jgi:hypothetical protein
MYKVRCLDIYINRGKYESRTTQKNNFLLTKQKDYFWVTVEEAKESERWYHIFCACLTGYLHGKVITKHGLSQAVLTFSPAWRFTLSRCKWFCSYDSTCYPSVHRLDSSRKQTLLEGHGDFTFKPTGIRHSVIMPVEVTQSTNFYVNGILQKTANLNDFWLLGYNAV